MHACVYDRYGSPQVLHPADIPRPRRRAGQVLIRVVNSSINPIDYRTRRGELRLILPGGFPRVPGHDVAGYIVECDHDSGFAEGDRVVAYLDRLRGGAAAEFACCSAKVVAKLPEEIPFEHAAVIPLAGSTALQSLRDHGRLSAGQKVLINGASGGVGAFAVQIAKALGAEVTAVASAKNESFCRSLGASQFHDYHRVDFTTLNEQWDLIFDVAGKANYFAARRVLRRGGRFVTTEPDPLGITLTLLTFLAAKPLRAMLAKPKREDLKTLLELYQQGLLRVTIDKEFALDDLAAAHERLESGVERGKILIVHDIG